MTTYYVPMLDGILLPSQSDKAQPVKKVGEHTGMINCPMKMSEIAIERCAEYQQQLGCGENCPAKATPGQIRKVRRAKKERMAWRSKPTKRHKRPRNDSEPPTATQQPPEA